MTRQVFVDTWAWYALVNRSDRHHSLARETLLSLLKESAALVTSNFVFDETITLIRYHIGYQAAVRFYEILQELCRKGNLVFIRVSEEHEQEAWRLFRVYKDVSVSFTDCTSFAIMHLSGIEYAFTGDRHFTILGFSILPPD